MADEVIPQETEPTTVATETPTQPLSAQMEAASSATPEVTTTEGVTTPETPAAEWRGVRDFAKEQGIELPHDNDAAALNALIASYRQSQQRNYYAELGQRIAPHATQIQQFLRQQAQPAPQAPPAWKPPEFRKDWLQQVERDPETGLLRAKAGYDPSLPEKVQAYADWRDKFLDSPDQVLGPLVEERARAIVREEQGVYQSQSLANDLIARDAAWMFAAGPNGQRQLTPAGSLYAQAAKTLWDSGLTDVRMVHAQARATVENAVLRQQLASLQPAAAGAAALAASANPVNVGGTATRPAVAPAAVPASNKGRSLREMLLVNTGRLEGVPEDVSL